jgi:hypothetical protein
VGPLVPQTRVNEWIGEGSAHPEARAIVHAIAHFAFDTPRRGEERVLFARAHPPD